MKKFLLKINVIFGILKAKWIDGQCRHICKFCSFRNMCYDEIKYNVEKESEK